MMNDTDLDTIASSVAYAWFASVINITPHAPLLQALRRYVRLRPENVLAFFRHHCQRTGMSCSALTLTICLSIHFWSHSFRQLRLVDHNRLIQRFEILPLPLPSSPSLTITWMRDSTRIPLSQRIIRVPTGRCAKLISMHIINSTSPEFEVPPELTTHLLCGILIDTIGLKDGGKAVQADHYAAAYLI